MKRSSPLLLAAMLLVAPCCLCAQIQKDAFSAYTACSLPEGPSVVETAPFAPGIKERTVTTLRGRVQIPLVEGRRIMFAYPDEDFYANMKVEILPEQNYQATRNALIGDFDHMLTGGGVSRNYTMKPTLNSFDVRGLDREKREGGVLGVYLLFDDTTHIVTTVYFLNQEPPKRFQTMPEYAALRDRFLKAFTSCVRSKKL